MPEKFCLKWNDYQSNWNRSLSKLRNDNDFADVTLISEDKVKFSAHKVLLSSCSNMFKFILKSNTHHPLLFLCGVSSANLGFILDYIYHGETQIFQEQLDSFLESAQKLEIEGLLGREDNEENINTETEKHHENNEQPKVEHPHNQFTQGRQMLRMNDNTGVNTTRRQFSRSRTTAVEKIDVASLSSEEIKDKIKELYEKIDGVWSCLACDYTTTSPDMRNIRRHVEIHLDGLCYTCNICSKEFRSRNCLNMHKSTSHKH